MKTRRLCVLLTAVMMIGLFSSCDSEEAAPSGDGISPPAEVSAAPQDKNKAADGEKYEGDVNIVRNSRGQNFTASDGTRILTVTVTVPEIQDENYSEAAAIINEYYLNQQEKHYQYAEQELYEYAIYAYTNTSGEFVPHTSEQFFTLEYNSGGYLSFMRMVIESSGDNYVEISVASETFDAMGGGLVTAAYMFSCEPDEAMERVAGEICAQISERVDAGEVLFYENAAELVPAILQPDSFYLTEEGVVYYFQVYEIARVELGAPEFLIPYEKIEDIFTLWQI